MSSTEKLEKASAVLNNVEVCFPRAVDAAFAVITTPLSIVFVSWNLLNRGEFSLRSRLFDFSIAFRWRLTILT
jgi:hypothetical protein